MVSEERPEGVTSHSIGAPLDGERLDRVVSMLWDCSRSEASTLIAAGEVRLDDEVVTTKSRRVVAGDAIELRVAAPTGPALPLPQGDLELDVVDEDESIIVIDKAAGMVVHPAPGHPDGTLVNALLARYPELAEVGEPQRPGIVHRLDRDTSGLMVVARTQAAYEALVDAMAEHRVDRRYLALVHGRPETRQGTIEAPVGRSRRDPLRMAVTQAGRSATTHYSLNATWHEPAVSLLDLALETGRTHQIRVHLASLGWYVVGDPTYGRPLPGHPLSRPFLHAVALGFAHPADGHEVAYASPLATELQGVLDALGAGRRYPADRSPLPGRPIGDVGPRRIALGHRGHVGQAVAGEVLPHALAGIPPHGQEHALALVLAGPVGVGEAEVAGLDRPVDRRHDVGEGDLRGATGQDVPAADAPL